MRKGLGIRMGKGYYNLVPNDKLVHSFSAKGISSVNLSKYQGRWYDQASVPQWFDMGCEGQIADYKLRKDGKVDVLNTCKEKYRTRMVKGTARSVSKDNKKLKVSFIPFIEGDYNIEYLDKDYKEAVVGSGDDSLWILTRKRKSSQKELNRLKKIAKEKGYDVSKLKEMTLNAKGQRLELKAPTVQILSAKKFDTKFKDDYEDWEQGYATTKIHPDGTTNVFVRDDGNKDYTKEGKLLMHELKEIEIFKDLVNNKKVDPAIADEMAHNMNPVKIDGVSEEYPIDPNN